MVVDTNMMLVPDPAKASQSQREKVAKAFARLKGRNALQFLSERRLREMSYRTSGRRDELNDLSDNSELDMPDRRELDNAVLSMLGVKSQSRRDELIEELYSYLRTYFEGVRQKEERAIANKSASRKKGRVRPAEVAKQVLDEVSDKHPRFLRTYASDFFGGAKVYDTYDIPAEGEPTMHTDLFNAHGVAFKKGQRILNFVKTEVEEQATLIILLADSGVRGLARIPRDPIECTTVFHKYLKFVKERNATFRELISDRTSDPEMQGRIFDALIAMIKK